MKRNILCSILLVFISIVSNGQTLAAVDTGKYSIHLPSYWKPGNKVWEVLTDKLPLVCEELKDKDLCGDRCNPKYSIEFYMSEPDIFDYYSNHISSGNNMDTWEFVTLYRFSSSLLLFDEKDKLLTRFILVDTNEVWRVIHRVQLPAYTPPPPQKIYLLSSTSMNQTLNNDAVRYARNGGTMGQSPFTYINNNKEKLSPTQRDMLNVIDEKIRSW